MRRALVLYGTTDGHTHKVAHVVGTTLRALGAHVDIVDARSDVGMVRAVDYDAVVVAASVHAGGLQRPVGRWLRVNAAALNTRPTAFLTVCLAVLEHRAEADARVQKIVGRFLHSCGWQPNMTRIVAGAIPYTRYGWFKKRVMRRIAAKAGGSVDTTRDYEYTDWTDLKLFVRSFVAQFNLAAGAAGSEPRLPMSARVA